MHPLWAGNPYLLRMKTLIRILSLVVASLCSGVGSIGAQVNVTQEHNNLSRDGLYVDSAFTLSAAANVTRDLNFDGTISGNVYAQPLYVEGGPSGRARVIVVTESNNVYALDAITGTVIWNRNVARPLPPVSLAAISARSASPARLLSILVPGRFFSMP